MIEFGSENIGMEKGAFLERLEEGEDNKLTVTISLSTNGEVGENIPNYEEDVIKRILEKAKPVYPDKENTYEIYFDNYVMYQVRNESFAAFDEDEARCGNRLIIFEKSKLLDYVKTVVWADEKYFGGYKHYGIYTENQIIDVISQIEPTVKKL
ncbi:MAG: hypothetical protein IJ435_09160 [Clostridia bacterium]|nr:hypothetical protein [Clostridia bacterium]